jgi:hypothetical protein
MKPEVAVLLRSRRLRLQDYMLPRVFAYLHSPSQGRPQDVTHPAEGRARREPHQEAPRN